MYAARPAQPDRITSLHNPRIKEVLRLQDKSAERRRQGLTLVEGYRELANARQAGWQLATLLLCAELAGDEITQELSAPAHLVPRPYELLPVSSAVFAKLAVRERSDGVLALLRTPTRTPTAERVRAGLVRSFQVTRLFPDLSAREHLALTILQREGLV